MKKNEYRTPEMQVVDIQVVQHIMAGSTKTAGLDGIEETTEYTGGSITW